MVERGLKGLCDLNGDYTGWNMEGCDQFNQKDKQVVEKNMPPYCLKVCGNCEYFTVAEFEVYANPSSERPVLGRVG